MKLVEVMACVDRVAKNGVNETQKYSYAMAADIYDAVRAELAKRFVLPCPNPTKWDFTERESRSGGKIMICTVHGTLDFLDAETGESMSRPMLGQGSDSLDKASYKAMTGAMKNALVHQFLIPTGDDPENEPKGKPQPPPPPAGLAGVKAKMPAAQGGQSKPSPAGGGVAVFPNYGRSKGAPILGASEQDLDFYANGAKRTLADPAKANFHETERKLLIAIDAEVMRQRTARDDEPPLPSDEDAPF